jgi:ribosomal protein S18 acetylase RimI-like enzyme
MTVTNDCLFSWFNLNLLFGHLHSFMVSLVLGPLTEKNIGQLRVLNTQCFPVRYQDSFYEQLKANADLVRLGHCADCLVAAIGCKIQSSRLYIMTLGVLENYRRCNFGSQLVEWAVETARKKSLGEIALHVQTNNIGAIEFYKKHGFTIIHTDPNYYPQLDPSGAHYLVRKL